jgi:hypothetical protein
LAGKLCRPADISVAARPEPALRAMEAEHKVPDDADLQPGRSL